MWLAAEYALMIFDRAGHLRRRIFGVALQMPRQIDVRHRLPGQALVDQQRQDRMIKGRCRQLELSAGGQLTVQRNHLPQQFELLVEQPLFFVFRPMLPFAAKLGQVGIDLEGDRMEPDEIAPALQIEHVVRAKAT